MDQETIKGKSIILEVLRIIKIRLFILDDILSHILIIQS